MMLLGSVADDLTGATDLADALAEAGCRTEVFVGVPPPGQTSAADAVVVALKTRTAPVGQAVGESLEALRWLRANGAPRVLFKVCSTFDSTDEGNIGPVADAFRAELGAATVAVCPAFPTNGRTVYLGHLFVGTDLLSDTGMAHHPLTPMTDSSLVRVLGRQSRGDVTLVSLNTVRAGAAAVAAALTDRAYTIVDAVADADLATLAAAVVDHPLTIGGSALGGALANALHAAGAPAQRVAGPPAGPAVVLSGSCSVATRAQVAAWPGATVRIDPRRPDNGSKPQFRVDETLLISTTAPPEEVAAAQAELGVDAASAAAEGALAVAAQAAVDAGVTRMVIAGGETSGAVLTALGVTRLEVGRRVSPGVPWMIEPATGRWFVLKSGNFGGPDFFADALALE